MSSQPFLTLTDLDKRFGTLHVLKQISLTVERGEVLALLGPSGSGKTTLLRLLAGFESADAGSIRVDDEEVTPLPPARRRFGMVFQHYALFPHLSVGENIAFGLASREPGTARRRVAEMLELVDLVGFEERRVGEISGGQQQRIALARALAPEPRVLLLDEPLSNLDPSLRERTRRQLKQTIRRVGITTVLVTHEQEEAFDLGDRVAVLHDGVLDQVGAPEALYRQPATRFVATFVGRANVLPGTLLGSAGESRHRVRLEAATPIDWEAEAGDGDLAADEAVDLVVRPESLTLTGTASPSSFDGRIVDRRFVGVATYVQVKIDGMGEREVEVLAPSQELPETFRPGSEVTVAPCPDGPPPRIFRRREEPPR